MGWVQIPRVLSYSNPFGDLDQMCVALRHFCRIVCFLCPLYVLSDGFHGFRFVWFLQCIVYCSHGMDWNKLRLVETLYPRGL